MLLLTMLVSFYYGMYFKLLSRPIGLFASAELKCSYLYLYTLYTSFVFDS